MLDFVAPRKSSEDGVQKEQVCTTYCRRRRFETATAGKCGFIEGKSRVSGGAPRDLY